MPNDCLCHIRGFEIVYCPLHEAAPELLKLLRSVREACNHRAIEMIGNEVVQLIPQIDAAIEEK